MKNSVKILILISFIGASTGSDAQKQADTITNWQLYKGKELLFKSNYFDSRIHTGIISSKDNFDHLRLYIFHDFLSEKISRKIEFVLDGKVLKSISEYKLSREPFSVRREEIENLIIEYHDEILALKYIDKVNPNGILIGLLEFTD